MQTAILIDPSLWDQTLARIDQLEKLANSIYTDEQRQAQQAFDTHEAAAYLGINVESVRRARRCGRLTGRLRNERDYEFTREELDRYKHRYNRDT